MDENLKLSSPWERIHHILLALFATDEDIVIGDIDDEYNMDITVYNYDKFQALDRILKKEFELGNITLKITLLNAVDNEDTTPADDLVTIFEGNPYFSRVEVLKDPMGFDKAFCLFSKEVFQYYNDNACDPRGIESNLVEKVALELFECEGVNFTTESEEPLDDEDDLEAEEDDEEDAEQIDSDDPAVV